MSGLSVKCQSTKNSASLLTCVVLTFIIVIPLLFVFAAIVQQGSVFSQNTYKWVTNGGIQDIFQHPWVIKGLSIVNEYLPFDKIEPKAIAEKNRAICYHFWFKPCRDQCENSG